MLESFPRKEHDPSEKAEEHDPPEEKERVLEPNHENIKEFVEYPSEKGPEKEALFDGDCVPLLDGVQLPNISGTNTISMFLWSFPTP